jgi:prophage regulatory protein
MPENKDKLLRIQELRKIIPVSKATIYRLALKYPLLKPIKIGGSSFWSENNAIILVEELKNKNINITMNKTSNV